MRHMNGKSHKIVGWDGLGRLTSHVKKTYLPGVETRRVEVLT